MRQNITKKKKKICNHVEVVEHATDKLRVLMQIMLVWIWPATCPKSYSLIFGDQFTFLLPSLYHVASTVLFVKSWMGKTALRTGCCKTPSLKAHIPLFSLLISWIPVALWHSPFISSPAARMRKKCQNPEVPCLADKEQHDAKRQKISLSQETWCTDVKYVESQRVPTDSKQDF